MSLTEATATSLSVTTNTAGVLRFSLTRSRLAMLLQRQISAAGRASLAAWSRRGN